MDSIKRLTSFPTEKITRPLLDPANSLKVIGGVIAFGIIIGIFSGYNMAGNKSGSTNPLSAITGTQAAKSAEADTKTFKDFAQGTIKAKPKPKDPTQYTEGTHVLQRDGAYPVALTSSVVDLSEYEGKKVKVFGETQKALKEGWLMDVGKVEEIK